MTLTQKRRNENEIEVKNTNDEVLYPKFMVCFLIVKAHSFLKVFARSSFNKNKIISPNLSELAPADIS